MLIHPEVMGVEALAAKIRKIENWPQKGILFHDITPVLQSAEYFRLLVDLLVYRYMGQKIDAVAGLDARGFIIGAALAYQLNVGFVPIRKKGKLPFDTVSQSYALEYGEAWMIWWRLAARCWRVWSLSASSAARWSRLL